MSGGKAVLALIAVAVVAKFGWSMYSNASFSPLSLPTKELSEEFQKSFKEVSPDYKGWMKKQQAAIDAAKKKWPDHYADSLRRINTARGAYVAAAYATEDEIVDLYRWRAAEMMSGRLPQCQVRIPGRTPPTMSGETLLPFVKLAGHAFAREHMGKPAWEATVDKEDAGALKAFVQYLADNNMQETMDAFSGRGSLPGRQCFGLGKLYDRVVKQPDDKIGNYTLLEFVRSMDVDNTRQD